MSPYVKPFNIYNNMWCSRLNKLLDEAIQYPERRGDIESRVKKLYGRRKAFMVLDMSGFSKTTKELGIFHFMMMIHHMRLVAVPCITEHSGIVIKEDADNLFCFFNDVQSTCHAAKEIIERLRGTNAVLPVKGYLYVTLGVGFGDILNIENKDMFGDEVNLACKLGEDVGSKNQILLTQNAFKNLRGTEFNKKTFKKKTVRVSGVKIPYYVLTV